MMRQLPNHRRLSKGLFLIGFVMSLWGSSEAGMVPSNVLQRVFSLRVGPVMGTGFTVEVDGRQYFITAKHVLASAPSLNEIEVLHDKKWVKVPVRSVPVEPSDVDIAVLVLPQRMSPLHPVQLGIKGTYLSQEVFFVGFPFGLSIDGNTLNAGFPLPLVKHGIISSLGNGGSDPFLIDGTNNPGFSGGPVVRSDSPQSPSIIGVISGYRIAQEPVYKQLLETDLSTRANSGLVVAYSIDFAVDAIKKNPIGFRLDAAP